MIPKFQMHTSYDTYYYHQFVQRLLNKQEKSSSLEKQFPLVDEKQN